MSLRRRKKPRRRDWRLRSLRRKKLPSRRLMKRLSWLLKRRQLLSFSLSKSQRKKPRSKLLERLPRKRPKPNVKQLKKLKKRELLMKLNIRKSKKVKLKNKRN